MLSAVCLDDQSANMPHWGALMHQKCFTVDEERTCLRLTVESCTFNVKAGFAQRNN